MLLPVIDSIFASTAVVSLALAYGVLYGVLGAMDLTVGSRFAAAGFAGWLVTQAFDAHTNPTSNPLVWFGAILGTVAVTIPIWVLLRPLNRQAPLVMLVGSLGLASALQAAYHAVFGATPRTFTAYPAEAGLPMLGTTATPLQLIALGYLVASIILLAVLFHGTSFGRKLKVLAGDPEVALTVFSLDSDRLTWKAVIASSALLAPAGLLYSIGHGISPTTGTDVGLLAFVATIVAGRQNPLGAAGTALVMMMIATFSIRWSLNEAIAGVFGVAFVLGVRILIRRTFVSRRLVHFGTALAAVGAVVTVGHFALLVDRVLPHYMASAQLPSAYQPLVPYFVIVPALLLRPTSLFRNRQRVV